MKHHCASNVDIDIRDTNRSVPEDWLDRRACLVNQSCHGIRDSDSEQAWPCPYVNSQAQEVLQGTIEIYLGYVSARLMICVLIVSAGMKQTLDVDSPVGS
jgi:hypothetical protein